MSIYNTTTHVSVQDEVEHWTAQAATNPQWNDTDRELITKTVAAICGKTKADALAALKELSTTPTADPTSRGASFARYFTNRLKYGL